MTFYNNFLHKKLFGNFLFTYVIGFAFSFAFVYWIGTKDLGLCFVISLALVNGTSAAQKELLGFGRNHLVPAFSSIDTNINNLFDAKNEFECRINELEDKVRALNYRIKEFENKI